MLSLARIKQLGSSLRARYHPSDLEVCEKALARMGVTLGSALAPHVETVHGNPTEVVRVGGGPLRLVFVPGNPGRCRPHPHATARAPWLQQKPRLAPIPTPTRMVGIASFYGSTAAALAESLDASAAVIGFRGHTLNPLLSPTQAFDLEQQVDHVAGFLEGELAVSGEADLVVVGHSIGAWVALEAVRRLGANQRRVAACIGLMPYLTTETPSALAKGALIRRWFAPALAWLLAGVAQLIGWLPRRAWRLAALRLLEPEIAGYEPDQREIAELSLPRFGTLLNILTLFRAEATRHAIGSRAVVGMVRAEARHHSSRSTIEATHADCPHPHHYLHSPPSASALHHRLSPHPHPKQARNHASPYDFSRLDGFRERVCLLVSPGDPWCCSEVRGMVHGMARCIMRCMVHCMVRYTACCLPLTPPAVLLPSRRAAPPRRAWPCIGWRGCRTPSARSLPRARPSSHGSRRPSASCAAAAAAAAAAAVAAAWRQAHGSRPRAACRDRLRARRCMGPSELLIRELGPRLSPQQAIWSPLSALCVASRLDEYLGLGAFV